MFWHAACLMEDCSQSLVSTIPDILVGVLGLNADQLVDHIHAIPHQMVLESGCLQQACCSENKLQQLGSQLL